MSPTLLGLRDGLHSRTRLSDAELEELLALVHLVDNRDGLHFRLNEGTLCERSGNSDSDFLWVEGGRLLGYLGLFQFLPDTVEVNGLVHPDWRRRGIFSRMWELARAQCIDRGAARALLICEKGAEPGQALMRRLGARLENTEYKLSWRGDLVPTGSDGLILRAATPDDISEIASQNAAYFGGTPQQHEASLREAKWAPLDATEGRWVYLAELGGVAVGKVDVGVRTGEAWIYGLGIRDEWRGRGFGRALLQKALALLVVRGARSVLLEVEARNERAFSLYTSCGFVPEVAYDYYALDLPAPRSVD